MTQKQADELERVRGAELELEIKKRRAVAGLNTDDLADNLIGLAFSGGGIRSGAINLGVLQGLDKRGVLRYVDYLSTVSGGGFAGAYMSSDAVRRAADAVPSQKCEDQPTLSISQHPDGRFVGRLREFLGTGRKMNRPLVFLNRHLIGLLLTWIVVAAGLTAIASGSAWLFRLIYDPNNLDRLASLGFHNDLEVCLFPPLAIFVLWLSAWGVSYFQRGARATGEVARVLFFMLLITSGISLAAILGAGDIDISPSGATTGQTDNSVAGRMAASLQTLILSAVVAGLLPYLNPMRLFRSGAAPKRPVEKYIYAVASRMLVFGLPFLVMSYFVQEDISGWYSRRDGSLFRSEIKNLNKLDPEYQRTNGLASIWPPGGEPGTVRTAFQEAYAADRLTQQYQFHAADPNPDLSKAAADDAGLVQRPVRFWHRWGRLLEYVAYTGSGRTGEGGTAWRKYIQARADSRRAQQEIAEAINERLRAPQFAQMFLLESSWTAPSDRKEPKTVANEIDACLADLSFPDSKSQESWVSQLLAAREEAKRVGAQYIYKKSLRSAADLSTPPSGLEAELRKVVDANRRLLQAYYGDALAAPTTVFSGVVWEEDQATRKRWFLGALFIFVVAALFVDLNATSCHGFYAKHTADGWIESVPGFERNIPLTELNNTDVGSPYHLICGSVRMSFAVGAGHALHGRESFLFSRRFCGCDRLAYLPTSEFMQGRHTLPDAVAASGGAVSPTESGNPLTAALLVLTNFRLGQWLENPAFHPLRPALWEKTRRWPFTPARWLWSQCRAMPHRSHILVTDGGYHENLGIEALLRRRCKLIIAVDAGQDEAHDFEDFARLVRRAKVEHGIVLHSPDNEVERKILDAVSLPKRPPQGSDDKHDEKSEQRSPAWTPKHHTVAKIIYPDGKEGVLLYLKSSMTGDEPLELIHYQRQHPNFPHDTTSDQLYDGDQFLSYFQLGRHMADKVAEMLPEHLDVATSQEIAKAFAKRTPEKFDAGPVITAIDDAIRDAVHEESAENIAFAVGKITGRKAGPLVPVIRAALAASRDQLPEDRVAAVRRAVGAAFMATS